MESKTFKKIGIIALIIGIFYFFSRSKESKSSLENKLQDALNNEDYETANKIRSKLKKFK